MLCRHFDASSVLLQNQCSEIKPDAAVLVLLSVILSGLPDIVTGLLELCKLQLKQLGEGKCVFKLNSCLNKSSLVRR